jgi:hypothetical protein
MWSKCWNRSKRILVRTPPRTLPSGLGPQQHPPRLGQRTQLSLYLITKEPTHHPHYLMVPHNRPRHRQCRPSPPDPHPHLDLYVLHQAPICPSSSRALCLLSTTYLSLNRRILHLNAHRRCQWLGQSSSLVYLPAHPIDRLPPIMVLDHRWLSDP